MEIPTSEGVQALSGGGRVFLREIRISGATALTSEELVEIASPYVKREVSFADLAALRDQITLAYVERGYVSSGALIPDQSLEDGVLEIRVVEGILAAIEIETDGRFRASYVANRVRLGASRPVNIHELERQLQILQRDERIRTVNAVLTPTRQLGQSSLRVAISEESPYQLGLEFSNHEPPSVGSQRVLLELGHRNVSGLGDFILASYRKTEGLHGIDAQYTLPLNARDTLLDIHLERTWSEVVEEPFDELDIKGKSETYGFTVSHPVYRSGHSAFHVSFTGEHRRSESFLFGSGFSFSEGPEEGVSQVTVLRLGQSWSYGSQRQAVAARSVFSWGIEALGATTHRGSTPDGRFFSWLGQIQWARRLSLLDAQLTTRLDLQISDSPLLGLEQFSLGGHSTVRGYRENVLVRDSGAIGSLELRVPLWQSRDELSRVEIAPFVDAGYGWNQGRRTLGPRTLIGAGVGGRWVIRGNVHLEAYWGRDLKEIGDGSTDDLQDDGFHLRLGFTLP